MKSAVWFFALSSALSPITITSTAASSIGSVYDNASNLSIAHQLEAELRKGGNAEGILERKLNDFTQIAVRVKSGRAEFHQNSGDIFFVLEGSATLVSGGAILHGQGSVEVRGDSIEGGTQAAMHRGDIVYIPPATPHQVVLAPGDSFLYVVVKVPRKQ